MSNMIENYVLFEVHWEIWVYTYSYVLLCEDCYDFEVVLVKEYLNLL